MTGLRELLLSRIRDVADYPEPGVMFKDITPLLADPEAFGALTDALAGIAKDTGAVVAAQAVRRWAKDNGIIDATPKR
jgi:adenine phosphoribosyltransferase